MKIPKDLPQFDNSPSLLIVAGWQTAKIFYVSDGNIDLEKNIETDKRKYSDKEGFFKTKSRNVGGMHSGAPLEEDKNIIRKYFMEELIPALEKIIKNKNIEFIYLFSPEESLHDLESSLTKDLRDIIKGFYVGNFHNLEPLDILKKIKKEKPKPIEIMSEEAKKILDKGKNK